MPPCFHPKNLFVDLTGFCYTPWFFFTTEQPQILKSISQTVEKISEAMPLPSMRFFPIVPPANKSAHDVGADWRMVVPVQRYHHMPLPVEEATPPWGHDNNEFILKQILRNWVTNGLTHPSYPKVHSGYNENRLETLRECGHSSGPLIPRNFTPPTNSAQASYHSTLRFPNNLETWIRILSWKPFCSMPEL